MFYLKRACMKHMLPGYVESGNLLFQARRLRNTYEYDEKRMYGPQTCVGACYYWWP